METGRIIALIVEDNEDEAYLTKRTLLNQQVADEVIVARDGIEAIAHIFVDGLTPRDPLPSFVLLDLNLPRMSGLAVLRRLRADRTTKRLPVVVVTGSREEQAEAECYGLGAASFVQKPLDSQKLLAALDDLHF